MINIFCIELCDKHFLDRDQTEFDKTEPSKLIVSINDFSVLDV